MSAWRRKALEQLPQFKGVVEHCQTIFEFWREVWPEFCNAYGEEPRNTPVIAGVYEFAFWCWHGSDLKGNNISLITAVFFEFFERIPSDPVRRRDIPNWLCPDEIEVLLAGPFSYGLNPDERELWIKEFRQVKQKRNDAKMVRCAKLKLQLPKS